MNINPSSDSPATEKPITAPPRKAIGSALAGPSRAASVVRAFAIVATVMPTYPAVADSNAPST